MPKGRGFRAENQMKQRFLFRAGGPRTHDVSCPIKCGKCCSYWRDVVDSEYHHLDKCPNMGEGNMGCMLKREDQPFECKYYLCLDAIKALGLDWEK